MSTPPVPPSVSDGQFFSLTSEFVRCTQVVERP
jgi:hypothetical protein